MLLTETYWGTLYEEAFSELGLTVYRAPLVSSGQCRGANKEKGAHFDGTYTAAYAWKLYDRCDAVVLLDSDTQVIGKTDLIFDIMERRPDIPMMVRIRLVHPPSGSNIGIWAIRPHAATHAELLEYARDQRSYAACVKQHNCNRGFQSLAEEFFKCKSQQSLCPWTAPLPSVFNCWYGYYILDGCVKLLTTRTEPTNSFLEQPYNETVPELSSDPRVHVIHWSGNRKQGHPSFWELDFSLVADGKPGIRSPTTFVRPSKESQHTGPTHLALARALTQYQTHVDAALNKLGYVTFMQHARAAPPPPPGSQLEPQDSRGKRIYPNHPANRTKLADWAP